MKIIDADALFEGLIFPTEQFKTAFRQVLDDEPAADLKKCFEGMTNGEVIKTLFPYFKTNEEWKATVHFYYDTDITEITACTTRDWWNAPYQKGGEE
jgi:hypothetical protein